MIHIDNPPLGPFSASNAEILATNRYSKLITNVMVPFAIVSVQANRPAIDESSIHKTVWIDSATFATSHLPMPLDASQSRNTLQPTLMQSSKTLMTHHNQTKHTPFTKSSQTKPQDITFAIEFSGVGIQKSMTLWIPRNTCRNTL